MRPPENKSAAGGVTTRHDGQGKSQMAVLVQRFSGEIKAVPVIVDLSTGGDNVIEPNQPR
jgi:hypothetical protein